MPPSSDLAFRTSKVTPAQVMDAVMLALRRSPMETWMARVGEARVREVLEQAWPKMWSEGALNLRPLLQALRGVSGFSEDTCVGAFCRIKTWEPLLSMHVDLPPEFLARGILDPSGWAMASKVTEAELAEVIPAVGAAPLVRRKLSQPRQVAVRPAAGARKWITCGVGLLVVLALVVGAVWWRLRPVPLDVNLVSDSIPLKEAQRQGSRVRATLREPAWVSFPRGERTAAMSAALIRLKRNLGSVQVVELVDDKGVVIAVAHEDGSVTLVR